MKQMDDTADRRIKKFLDKLYGGLKMSWTAVIIYAVAAAVITAGFLIVPVFRGTSFERMGTFLEAWIFLAVIIMTNCGTPLESAFKTFVFFLISQPLIYLIEVPFTDMGWGIFRYYTYWFMWTLITFPMAYAGWYINRKNWLSVLIFVPVLAFLTLTACDAARSCISRFPALLVTVLFCVMQIAVYISVFFSGWKRKAAGLLAVIITVIAFLIFSSAVDLNAVVFLPDDPDLSAEAYITTEEDAFAEITLESIGEGTLIRVRTKQYGTMDFAVEDAGKEYRYTLTVYEDEGGYPQVLITVR